MSIREIPWMRAAIVSCLALSLPAMAFASAQPSSEGSGPGEEKAQARVVAETMDSGDYTYAKIKAGDETYWLAAPRTEVKVGDRVAHPDGVPMYRFESKTLKRTFETVLFVDRLVVLKDEPTREQRVLAAHQRVGKPSAAAAEVAAGSIEKAKGGYTVEELYGRAKELAGKEVSVRGKVVKFNGSIMGRNWIHLRDGTGTAPANDLTVTSAEEAKVGDVVLVTGTAAIDKDFGAGYAYPLMIENARLAPKK